MTASLNDIRERIFRLDLTLSVLAKTHTTFSGGIAADDLTLPALTMAAGLSDSIQNVTGEPIVDKVKVEALSADMNLNFIAGDIMQNTIQQFKTLIVLRQKAAVSLINRYRIAICQNIESLYQLLHVDSQAEIEPLDEFCHSINTEVLSLIADARVVQAHDVPNAIVESLTELTRVVSMLTNSEWSRYFEDLSINVEATVNRGAEFNVPKLALKIMQGEDYKQYATPSMVHDTVIGYMDRERYDGGLKLGFTRSDCRPEVKQSHMDSDSLRALPLRYRALAKEVVDSAHGSSIIMGNSWIRRINDCIPAAVNITPSQWLARQENGSHSFTDLNPQEEPGSDLAHSLLFSSDIGLEYAVLLYRLTETMLTAHPIIMNYCVNCNQ